MGSAPVLTRGSMEMIVQLGRRRKGVTAPEVAERFGITHNQAWRALQRLVKRGKLHRTRNDRMRRLLFERGRGAVVYKVRPLDDAAEVR